MKTREQQHTHRRPASHSRRLPTWPSHLREDSYFVHPLGKVRIEKAIVAGRFTGEQVSLLNTALSLDGRLAAVHLDALCGFLDPICGYCFEGARARARRITRDQEQVKKLLPYLAKKYGRESTPKREKAKKEFDFLPAAERDRQLAFA